MSIANEIIALNTNLTAAKNAVTTKGGTVGDTGLAGLANEIATIPSGSEIAKPTTWAELKAMSAADLEKVFPEGSIIDSIDCEWTNVTGATKYDVEWQVASYGTCVLENDETEYPCVTLTTYRLSPLGNAPLDGPEGEVCDSATETVAEEGVYYYGTSTASGNIAATNTTALNLATGDAIPYGDYARIFKHSLNTTVANFVLLQTSGYNNYKLSNLRQFLNSAANDYNWFVPTHVGDTKASFYDNRRGFQSGFTSDFLNVISPARVMTYTNSVTDGGVLDTVYDKFFIPSYREMRFASTPIEGDPFASIRAPQDRCRSSGTSTSMPSTGGGLAYRLRTAISTSPNQTRTVSTSGTASNATAASTTANLVACNIILTG